MKCPSCQHPSTQVLETRLHQEGETLKRRRKCENHTCGYRFVTYEKPHVSFPVILKRDGRREDYYAEKLRKAIQIATRKRQISMAQIDQLIESIEQKLLSSLDKEIQATELGAWVMAGLMKLDPVAYIRFASVYQNIQNLEEFSLLISPFMPAMSPMLSFADMQSFNSTLASVSMPLDQFQENQQKQEKQEKTKMHVLKPANSSSLLPISSENFEYSAIQNIKYLRLEAFKKVQGIWQIPGSKSLSNRLLLLLTMVTSFSSHRFPSSGDFENSSINTTKSIKSINQVLDSEDIDYMLQTLKSLGVEIEKKDQKTYHYDIKNDLIQGIYQKYLAQKKHAKPVVFDLFVGNAGTVMRPMLAVLGLLASLFKMIDVDVRFKLHGIERMHERPLAGLMNALKSMGCDITCLENQGFAPILIQGGDLFLDDFIKNSEQNHQNTELDIQIDGSQSSQFISSLLMALPLFSAFLSWIQIKTEAAEVAEIKSKVGIETNASLQKINPKSPNYLKLLHLIKYLKVININVIGEKISQPYIDMTIYCMRQLGVDILKNAEKSTYQYHIEQSYQILNDPSQMKCLTVEGDASSASYPIAAALIAAAPEGLLIKGIRQDSIQGDICFIQAIEQMNGCAKWQNHDELRVFRSELIGAEINCLNIPDAAMTLAILAVFAKGTTRLTHIHSWKLKETDRIIAMATELRKLGIMVEYDDDSITITPPTDWINDLNHLNDVHIHTYNDHRMAMCFSLIAFAKTKGLIINEPECVIKTYPNYFADLFNVLV